MTFKYLENGFYTMEHRGALKEALKTIKPISKKTFDNLIKAKKYKPYAYDERLKADRYIIEDLEHNYKKPCWLLNVHN